MAHQQLSSFTTTIWVSWFGRRTHPSDILVYQQQGQFEVLSTSSSSRSLQLRQRQPSKRADRLDEQCVSWLINQTQLCQSFSLKREMFSSKLLRPRAEVTQWDHLSVLAFQDELSSPYLLRQKNHLCRKSHKRSWSTGDQSFAPCYCESAKAISLNYPAEPKELWSLWSQGLWSKDRKLLWFHLVLVMPVLVSRQKLCPSTICCWQTLRQGHTSPIHILWSGRVHEQIWSCAASTAF